MNILFSAILAASVAATTATAATQPIEKTEKFGISYAEESPMQTAAEPELIIPEITGEQGRGTVRNLEGYFYENGYPEFISYVTAVDKFPDENQNQLIIFNVGLTDMSQENKDYLLDIADTGCYLNFEQGEYSFNQLEAVRKELMNENSGEYTVWFYGDDTVHVDVSTKELRDKYITIMKEKYGNMVTVSVNEGVMTGGGMELDGGIPSPSVTTVPEIGVAESESRDETLYNVLIISFCVALIIMIGIGGFMYMRLLARLSPDGTVAATLTKDDIVEAVKDSEEAPSPDVKDRIMKQLK